jgi:tyrosine-specific transport protein
LNQPRKTLPRARDRHGTRRLIFNFMKRLPLFESSATLIGTVIGAGILSIPFAMAQVGFWPGFIMLLVLGIFMMIRHLMLAEITLRTPHVHQTPGYSGIYLGKWTKRFDLLVSMIARYGSLLAYTVGVGIVLSAILGGSSFFWSVAFYLVGIIFVYFGLNIIKRSELVLSSFIFLITLAIGIFAWDHLSLANLNFWQPENLILPYGIFLFAFAGSTAIPLMREQLRGREKILFKSIIFGSVFVFIVYILFSFFVLGVTGTQTTQIATVGLGATIGPKMVLIGNLLAFFTMATSFLTIGLGTKEIFQFDYHVGGIKAWALTALVPIILFVIGARNFVQILGLTGGVLTGFQTLLLVLTYWQARKKGWREPEFTLGPLRITGALLLIVFSLGAVLTIVNTS